MNGQFAGNVLNRLNNSSNEDPIDKFWLAITAGSGKYQYPTDKQFEEALKSRPIFDVLRSKGTKYLLYSLEQHSHSAKGLPRYDDTNTSIEHIMPKTLSDEWAKYLGSDAQYHDTYLNNLGNLALTSNNSEMSNKLFDDKKDWYSSSSFYYTRKLGAYTQWNINKINYRSKQLAKQCVYLWQIPKKYQHEEDILDEKHQSPFTFSMINLEPGDAIQFIEDPSKEAIIVDDSQVKYKDKKYSLNKLAALLLGKDSAKGIRGPKHFSYEGESLADLRTDFELNVY